MTKLEMIRFAKTMQTQAIMQRAAIEGVIHMHTGLGTELHSQFTDTRATAQNHIDALQHVIDELQKEG